MSIIQFVGVVLKIFLHLVAFKKVLFQLVCHSVALKTDEEVVKFTDCETILFSDDFRGELVPVKLGHLAGDRIEKVINCVAHYFLM